MQESILTNITEAIYQHGFYSSCNFFNDAELNLIKSLYFKNKDNFVEAKIGSEKDKNLNKSIRNDKIFWIENNCEEFKAPFFNKINALLSALNRRCFLGLNLYEFHFATYAKGNYYKRHKDVFNNKDARKISVVLYLNKNWKKEDGGELLLYTQEKTVIIEPTWGNIAIFESSIEHEVAISNTDRLSLTGWLKNEKNIFT
ncbi:MAG: 2OG-Fe(II) oxygenase [Bacteroidetes bacterium]|nr:2OG-Fe(II) oxygenase [Bacteroidota bacterium]